MARGRPVTEPGRGTVRERRAARVVGALFLLATLAAAGLTVTYSLGGQPQVEGLLLGASLGCIGVACAVWAKHLLPDEPYVEERPPLDEGPAEAEALAADLARARELTRRPALVRLAGLAGAGLVAAFVLPIRSLGPRPGKSSLRTPWRGGRRAVTADGRPVVAAEVPVGGLVTIFPEHATEQASGQAVLLRVSPDRLRLPTDRRGWAPDGLVAYSKICTHAGCPVGLYQAESHTLLCPCHQSVFDVLRGARPVTGPAAWPLPQLPLAVDADGIVRATGDFSSPVGPGWWKDPSS
jgi:ubiquinol-cytochrome c reductase iron-sulfur subunit